MSNTNTGGPAFPVNESNGANGGELGMTLRDYFAAKAMQASINGHFAHYGHESYWPPAEIASYAYEVADAMLKAREA